MTTAKKTASKKTTTSKPATKKAAKTAKASGKAITKPSAAAKTSKPSTTATATLKPNSPAWKKAIRGEMKLFSIPSASITRDGIDAAYAAAKRDNRLAEIPLIAARVNKRAARAAKKAAK